MCAGTLDKHELGEAMRSMGKSAKEIQRAVGEMRGELVGFEEFKELAASRARPSTPLQERRAEAELRVIFDRTDTERSGTHTFVQAYAHTYACDPDM